MESNSMTMALAALAGIFCLLASGLLVALAMYQFQRSKPAAPTAPPVQPGLPSARLTGPLDPGVAAPASRNQLPADAQYDEEEMPTVIVNQPPPTRPAPAAITTPPAHGRTSGATIIAFDEDDDEDA